MIYSLNPNSLERCRRRQRFRSCLLGSFFRTASFTMICLLAARSSGFTPLHRHASRTAGVLNAALESMTVKELRQMVKESVTERGVLSKLKKKQDLIDFLEQTSTTKSAPIEITTTTTTTTTNDDAPNNTEPSTRARTPLGMPPVLETTDADASKLNPREVAFEQIYERYPSVRETPYINYTSPLQDVRQLHHPILQGQNQTNADMDLIFLGTASCTPSVTRGVSCTGLRLNWKRRSASWNPDTGTMTRVEGFQGGTWLFDVGECTQLQVQRSIIKPSKITKIFLTHAHGDHSFGLPGLLCLMGQDRDRDGPPVEIYGPEGLRMWLRVAIRYSVSRIVPPYRVHEIKDVPMAPEWAFAHRSRRYYYKGLPRNGPGNRWGNKGLSGEDGSSWISVANHMQLRPHYLYGEIDGGRDIYPIYNHPRSSDGAPVWEIEDEEDVKVYAAPMSHGIPCLGYVVQEEPRPGRLRNELVEPIVKRNVKALKEAGFRHPMKAMAVVKDLAPGSAFTFPDGTVVTQEEAVEPPRQGRKVVICGDTCDARAIEGLAQDADVVVHESTNAFLQGIDKDTDVRSVNKDAVVHGHSTPQIAGRFAQRVRAKQLILNHFSARYKGDVNVDSLSIMMKIEKQAMKASGLTESDVAAAWDLMALPIHAK